MNKILCPVDFSDTSLNAIEYAAEIGKKFRSSLTLVHIFTEDDFNKIVGEESISRSFNELLEMANEKLKLLAERVCEDYISQGIVGCDYHVGLGDFSDRLLEMMEEDQYDLLVVGTTGISQVSGVFFGSNTEELIERSRIPLLCVPENASFKGLKKIVYASDFLKEDRLAIQEVISLATVFDARIHVLHINIGDDGKQYEEFIKDLQSFIQYKKINYVNKTFKNNIGLGIEEFMQDEDSDMLVVLKKHRSFLGSMFHKSLTKTLSYYTDKPLFVLKLENKLD